MPLSALPISPVSLRRQAEDPAGFAGALGQSFQETGFAILCDHGLDPGLLARADRKIREFFALPEAEKRRHHIPGGGGQRGYTPFGVEAAKGADKVDLKEFWHIGRDLPEGHPFARFMPPNVWPEEVPGFREELSALFAAFDALGAKVMAAIAVYLGEKPDYFDAALKHGNSVLRLLHYPPVAASADGIRAEAHEDINAITLLLGAEEAGLQAKTLDGQWLNVNPPPDAMVINIGDMLSRLTNDVLPSTTHRVTNPAPERAHLPRYSIPFFMHFAPDFCIRTMPGCITSGRPDRYPEPITAQAFLEQRLREIRLI